MVHLLIFFPSLLFLLFNFNFFIFFFHFYLYLGIITKLRKIVREDKELAKLDNAMKSKANELTSSVLDKCLPYGLVFYLLLLFFVFIKKF